MRTCFSLAVFVIGAGMCLLSLLSKSVMHARAAATYNEQIQAFVQKGTCTQAELREVVWETWTNRIMYLPEQSLYTVEDLKTAIASRFLGKDRGNNQDSVDLGTLDNAIRDAAGLSRKSDSTGLNLAGVLLMLVGAFFLGGSLLPGREPKA